MKKRILSLLLIGCMIFAMLPTAAVPVEAANYNQTYTGTIPVSVTLSSGTFLLDGCTFSSNQQAIIINGNVTLVIKGTVSITAGTGYAGIQVLSEKAVTILGYEGTVNSLTVRGGNAENGGNGANGQAGSSSGGGYGGVGGYGGAGGGAAIGSNGGSSTNIPGYNLCYAGAAIGTVNIDGGNLSLTLQGGSGGSGGMGGGGATTSDSGKSGGGGGGGGGGGFPAPAIGQGGANGMYGGNGGDGVKTSGTWGCVGGGGGGAGGYGYKIGGGGNGGGGACYNIAKNSKSGHYSNTVSPGNAGLPASNTESSLIANISSSNYAYPGQGGSATLNDGGISGGAGGVSAEKAGNAGQSIYPNSVTTTSYKTVCFNATGGNASSYFMTTGSTVGTMPSSNPTRSGYTFQGWNTKSDGTGSAVTAGTSLSSTINTYYALWKRDTFDVEVIVRKNTYANQWSGVAGDAVVLSTSYTNPQENKITATPVNGEFTFTGIDIDAILYVWAKNKAGVYVKQDGYVESGEGHRLFGIYYYDVTLTAGTGIQSVSGAGTYLQGETATLGAVPALGYTWSDWSDGNKTMTGRSIAVGAKTDLTANAIFTPSYTISTDKTALDFGSPATGYTQPSAMMVTVTNTGNQAVTLSQPTATGYIIGTLSKNELAPGETATFTVQPKVNLPYGSHDEVITVSTNHDTSATVSAKFNITDNTVPTAEISIGTNKWNSFVNTVTFGLFFKETKTVAVTANDTESGVAKVEYLLSDTKFEDKDSVTGTWNDITAAKQFSINPNSKQYIYVRVTDNDDNATVINTDGVVLYTDSSASATGITFTKAGTADTSTQVTLNGNTVKEIKNDNDVISALGYTVADDGTIAFKATYLDSLAAGDYTLTVSYNPQGETYMEAAGNTVPGTTTIDLTIQKADGSVTNISNIGKTYDGNAVSAPTYTKLGTGAATIEYKVKGANDSTYFTAAPKNAGDYTVRVSVAADGNYKAAIGATDFTISQKEVTISNTAVESTKEYDGKTNAKITNNGTLSANYDSNNLTIKAGIAAYTDKTVADGKSVIFSGFSLDGSAKDNYTLAAQPESTTANITVKEITVNVSVNNKQYDGTNTATFNGTPVLVGIVSEDTVQLVNGIPTFADTSVANDISINFTAFSISGTDAANYKLTQPTGITANIYNNYYAIQGSDYEVNSNDWLGDSFVITAKSGHELSKTNTITGIWTSSFSASDETANGSIGFYVRNMATGAISTLTAENYKIDKTGPTATIELGTNSWNKFLNTVTFGLFFKETKGVTVTPSDTASGIGSVEYLLSETSFENASDITGTWISLSSNGGSFNITPNSKQFIYTRVIDNVGNQTIVNSDGILIYTDSAKSTESITFTKTSTTDVSANVVLNGNTVKEIKNGSNVISSSNYTVDSAGEIIFKASYLDTLAADSYILTVSYNPLGETYSEKDGNAAPATTAIMLIVQKADNSVTNISDIGKTYDGTAVSNPDYYSLSAGTARIEYKVKGENDNTYSTAAPKNAGEYTVRVSVATDTNYKEASGVADFTIIQKPVTINSVAVETTKEYDGKTDAKITNNGTLSANYDGTNLTFKVGTAVYNDKAAANDKTVAFAGFELTGSAKDNYKLVSQPVSLTANITAKALTVTLAVKDKLYNDKNNADFDGTPSLVGIVNEDTVDLTNGTPTFASTAVADHIAIHFTAFSISGADVANYSLTQPAGITASIKPYFVAKDAQYSVNSSEWLGEDFIVTAKPGFKVSGTNIANGFWSDTLNASDETDSGRFNFYVMDTDTGIISEKVTENYKIDKTAPMGTISIGGNSWNKFLNTITFGLFFNATQTVSIEADNDLSGIAKIEYAAVSSQLSLDDIKALTWTEGRSINVKMEDAKQFIYYAKIIDNAGNVSYLSTDGAEYDTTSPDIAGIRDGGVYYTTQTAAVTDKNLTSAMLNGEAKTSSITLEGNTDAIYTIVATDKAGNLAACTVTMKTITSLSESIDFLTIDNVKSLDQITIEDAVANVENIDTTNATAAEQNALKEITDKCDSLLKKISNITAEIERITKTVNGYSLETIKSSDKAAIEQLIKDIDILTATQNLAVDEATALDAVRATANGLLTKIFDIAAEMERITDGVDGYDLATVKSSDKAAIEQLIKDIDTMVSSNMTENETTALNGIKTKAENLLAKIFGITQLIKKLTNKIDGYKLDEVNSTDKASIEQVITDLEILIATENLTLDEKAALGIVKTKANALLAKVADAVDASTKKEILDTESINKDNVKSSDKETLTKAKAALEVAIKDYEGNYTETERNSLKDQLTTVIAALAAIDNFEKVVSSIIALPEDTKVKISDKDAIYAAKAAYDALTDIEKTMVGSEYIAKLEADLKALANLGKSHSPQTGDRSNVYPWIALLFVSGGTLTVFGIKNRKRKTMK